MEDNYTRWINSGIEQLEALANESVESIWHKRLRMAGLAKLGDEEQQD